MLSKEEIEKAFEGMEYFIDDDYGGQYKSVVGNQDANSMLRYLIIRDYILNMQDRLTKLEAEKQNVIEKVEERLKELKSKCGGNTYHVQTVLNAKIREIEWALSLVKGENDG